ncbi:hypothetical protein ECANGB1_2746 [Enterospora canceri]|uniref:Uncharacterized protein n=1 Tax=Enterospora canceri TaxID=1081671 RepID=A0A1Y1S3V5_9MICR|nr:hypothetical protein ECANGB1_2746 [Enterospora canceri]
MPRHGQLEAALSLFSVWIFLLQYAQHRSISRCKYCC